MMIVQLACHCSAAGCSVQVCHQAQAHPTRAESAVMAVKPDWVELGGGRRCWACCCDAAVGVQGVTGSAPAEPTAAGGDDIMEIATPGVQQQRQQQQQQRNVQGTLPPGLNLKTQLLEVPFQAVEQACRERNSLAGVPTAADTTLNASWILVGATIARFGWRFP